jgi:hypothetical protein
MKLRHLAAATMMAVLAAASGLADDDRHHRRHRHGRWHRDGAVVMPYAPGYYAPRPVWSGYYAAPEVAVIRGHYAGRPYGHLPRGYAKRLCRHGYMPRGYYRYVEPFPVYVERYLAPLPYGYGRGMIGGRAVIFNRSNGFILDVIAGF